MQDNCTTIMFIVCLPLKLREYFKLSFFFCITVNYKNEDQHFLRTRYCIRLSKFAALFYRKFFFLVGYRS